MDRVTQRTIEISGLATQLAAKTGLSRGLLVRVEAGGDEGRQATIGKEGLSMGAGSTCDLVLTDPAVSRNHAQFLPSRGGALVRDLESRNGTYVGGARIQEAHVPIGGEVVVGETRLRIVDGGGPQIPPSKRERFGQLLGTSRVMREVFAVLELASPTDATLLLEGPSGTGKELTARAIHDHSQRAAEPFVIFDCGTVQKDLLASSLMGHKKGAFTGADRDRPGAFVEASGGTIFIDELGELPLASQTQLLRVLESGTVTAVGDDKARKVDVRVVAATNRDLLSMVEEGAFRLDLFHRLAVVHVRIPALKDRLDDLPPLIRGFYEGRGCEAGPIEGDNLDRLRGHAWEGNVRELRNVLERSFVLSGANAPFTELNLWLGPSQADAQTSAFQVDSGLPFKEAKEAVVEQFEAAYLPDLLSRHEGNLSAAARHAGLSRRHLRALLVKHGLRGDG